MKKYMDLIGFIFFMLMVFTLFFVVVGIIFKIGEAFLFWQALEFDLFDLRVSVILGFISTFFFMCTDAGATAIVEIFNDHNEAGDEEGVDIHV